MPIHRREHADLKMLVPRQISRAILQHLKQKCSSLQNICKQHAVYVNVVNFVIKVAQMSHFSFHPWSKKQTETHEGDPEL